MDAQMKKGILDALVLSILKEEDTYGYQLSEKVSRIIEVAETALYPVLRRLETQGLLDTYSVEYSGRLRKYYRITAAGIERLRDFVQELLELERVIGTITKGAVHDDGQA